MLYLKNIVIALLVPFALFGQRWDEETWGVQVGITSEFGTHVNNIGIKLQAYGIHEFVQGNTGVNLYYNLKNLGNRNGYVSLRINTGLVIMGGKQKSNPHILLGGLNMQSSYQYGLGYNYLWYLDNAGTSQRSGGVAAHVDDFSFYIENDFFSGQGKDQYRTSSIALMYHSDLWEAYLENTLWTGKTQNAPRKFNSSGDQEEYKDLSNNFLGNTSHGIISLGFNYLIHSGNIAGLNIGYDSELIRNRIQNKFMHDKKFIPTSIRKENPHYPILTEDGSPTFIKDKRRKDQFFFSGGLNQNLGY